MFNGVNDECAKELADALKVNTSLQNFNLVENYIGDEGITAIAEALKSPTTVVHSLYLCGNDITEKGATAIASMLESNDTVKSITLSGNEARDAGTAALFRALTKNRSLTQLDLSNNLIGAAGMRAVKKCLVTNETLTELSFAQNGLGNGDIHILASALPTNTALRALDLEENLVTNEGVRVILENMERNHSMELLHLTMSEEDTRQMKAIVQRNIKERVTRNMFWYQLAPMTVGLRASTYIDSRGAREDDRNNNLKHSPSSSGAINLNSYDEDNGKDMLDKDDNCNHDNGNGSNSSRSSSRKTDDSDNDDGKDKGSTTCHYSNLSRHAHNSKADNENCNSINHTKQKSNTSALYRIRNSIRFSSILPCIRSYLIGEDQAVDCSQPCKASSTSVSGNTSVQVTEKHGMNGRALDLFMNGSFMQSMEKGLPVTADNMTKEELWIMFDERQRQRRDVDQLRQRNRVLTAVIAKLNAEIDGHGERNAELRKEQMTLSEKMKNVSEMNLALVQEAKTRESEMSVLRAEVTQLEIQLSMNQHGDSTDASDACGNINPDTRSGLRKKRKL